MYCSMIPWFIPRGTPIPQCIPIYTSISDDSPTLTPNIYISIVEDQLDIVLHRQEHESSRNTPPLDSKNRFWNWRMFLFRHLPLICHILLHIISWIVTYPLAFIAFHFIPTTTIYHFPYNTLNLLYKN